MTLPLRASFQGKREENSVRLLKLVSMLGSTTREASIPAGAQDGEALLLEVLLKVKALGNHQVRLFATPWTAAHAAEDRLLCPQNSPGKNTGVGCRALLQGIFPTQGLNPMSIESVMPSSHLILCHPLLFLSPVPPSIRVFSNESTLHMR